MKNLVIGGASNYDWNDLKYWVKSIKKTGFDGDIALVITNVSNDTIKRLTDENVKLFIYGTKTETGFQSTGGGAPHVERFFYLWSYMTTLSDYDNVVVTDTRDVIFQKNPNEWFETHAESLFCASEGLIYRDEPWGDQNYYEAFGPFFHEKMRNNLIYNVGTISGKFSSVKDLLVMIFQLSINRPAKVVDQAVFNFLMHLEPYKNSVKFCTNKDLYAIQLGTSEYAVKAGSGDIGMKVLSSPTELLKYQLMYKDEQPVIDEDGYVKNQSGELFFIVHQYDRVPELKTKVINRYED